MIATEQLPSRVQIVEVGPRDGLQNEREFVPTEVKLAFIEALADSGLAQIEVTSFVNPKRVPQLSDAVEIVNGLRGRTGRVYSALVPNLKGLERAVASGVRRVAVFTAASETFTQRNIGMSIAKSLETFEQVVRAAKTHGISVRGYVSTCFVCPYEGEIDRERVRDVTLALLNMGVDQAAISDTLGAAGPKDVLATVGYMLEHVAADRLALHLHDTYGTALANVYAGLQLGISTFDSSAGGLGGCPFAPDASGNLATEDLVYFLDRMGIESGVDLAGVAKASQIIETALGRDLPSKLLKRRRSGPARR